MIGATLAAVWAVGAGILAPGACVVWALDLGRGPLERVVLAVAVGRLLLTLVTLAATSFGFAAAMPLWGAIALVVWAALWWRRRRSSAVGARPGLAWSSALPVLVPVAASVLLVGAVLARSGLVGTDGALVFYGKDASNDPLFYLALGRALMQTGLPLAHPFAARFPIAGHHGVFAAPASLELMGGGDPFDLSFRVLPLLNVTGLALTGFALVRALGGNAWGASIGATLLVVGADLSWPVTRLWAALGNEMQDFLGWALFGPFLLPVNPIHIGAQTVFAACLLLARLPAGGTRAAITAGFLLAGVTLFKVQLWAPFLGALVLVALWPPRALARPLRIAAAVAIVASLPAHLETTLRILPQAENQQLLIGFRPCIGCLPRYLMDATFGSFDLSFGVFDSFALTDLLAPRAWIPIGGATSSFLVIGLGARLVAVPELVRRCRFRSADADAAAIVQRVLLFAGVSGVALACAVGAEPHYLNGGQFAWSASFALWLTLGALAGRWLTEGKRARVALVLVLSLASSWRWIHDQGWAAPPMLRVEAEEQALLRELAAHSEPTDLVLEPSWLISPLLLSPVAWLAGRPVYLSSGDVAAYLPSWEHLFRVGNIHHVFERGDATAARSALRATRARFVYAPAAFPLRFDPGDALEEVARNAAGVIYRVRPDAASESPRPGTP